MTNPDAVPFSTWAARARAQTEVVLGRFLPDNGGTAGLPEAMRYAALDGGKRIRAMLVFAAAELADADETAVAQSVAAVELLHAYSLVHDDLPAMDNDTLRRNKPTCHIRFGEAAAILAGDALQTAAFAALAAPNRLPAAQNLERICRFARAVGADGMVGGQFTDFFHVGRTMTQNGLETMHRMKTGQLIQAAVFLGYSSCADSEAHIQAALDEYAAAIGLAFQVVDDILDTRADSATLGKTAGKDAAGNKPTFVSLMGADGAQNYAQNLHGTALAALAKCGSRTARLRQLADYVVQRDF